MKKSAVLAATAATAVSVLLVPATAGAQQGVIPPLRANSDPCAPVTAEFRQSIAAAKAAKRAAYRAAQTKFHAATSDERTQVQAASRGKAVSYRVSTADERVERNNTRAAARSAFQAAVKAAKSQRAVGLSACR